MNARLLLLCLTLSPLCALADAVRVSLQPQAALGKGLPELRVQMLLTDPVLPHDETGGYRIPWPPL